VDVIDAARARADLSALEGQVAGLLAREDELAATDALPDTARTRLAGNDFRHDVPVTISCDENCELVVEVHLKSRHSARSRFAQPENQPHELLGREPLGGQASPVARQCERVRLATSDRSEERMAKAPDNELHAILRQVNVRRGSADRSQR
jgi:hypothetical protein